jgi:hypothetical protein
MSAAFLTAASRMTCPHGGQVMATPTAERARADAPILRSSDRFEVVGCAFSPGAPHPCVSVQWPEAAARVRHGGDFVLTENSVGQCVATDGAVQGFVMVLQTQGRGGGL